jgi:hypothetical protein
MKRVLLLVLLIVSIVEVYLERDRNYFFLCATAVIGLVRPALVSRRNVQKASKSRAVAPVNKAGGSDSACSLAKKVNGTCISRSHASEEDYAKAELTRQSAYTLSDGG